MTEIIVLIVIFVAITLFCCFLYLGCTEEAIDLEDTVVEETKTPI